MAAQPEQARESFGDVALIQVLHALLFGEAGPGQFDQTPPGGYSAADAARAILLVRWLVPYHTFLLGRFF